MPGTRLAQEFWIGPALVLVLELHLPAVHVTVAKETIVIHDTISDAAIKLHLLRVSALDGVPDLAFCKPMFRIHRQRARGVLKREG